MTWSAGRVALSGGLVGLLLGLHLGAVAVAADAGLVRSNVHWNDTDGNRIEAHAAGMLQTADGTWVWFGESKKTSDLSTHGVNAYTSASLAGPWKSAGQVLSQGQIKASIPGPYVVERPKVLYNKKTSKYVMWFHLDDAHYQFRHVGVATADNAIGPYTFYASFQPDGIPSLDMSLFLDPVDQQAYFIRSCDNKYAGISRLTDDYLNSTGIISTHDRFEGMAMFRHPNGTYYMVTSHLTGWNPNPLMLLRAAGKTLDDPQWVNTGNPTHNATSFNTQPTYVIQNTAADGSPYFMYMSDNWIHCPPDGTLINACYVWLPFQFSSDNVTLTYNPAWSLDHPFGQ